MVSYEKALTLIGKRRLLRDHETLPLDHAAGRVLAAPVRALVDRPMEALSAMDGYAVRLADVLNEGSGLKVIGEAPAGHPFQEKVGEGEAVRIFTGGMLPPGTDHVLIQEEVTRIGETISTQRAYTLAEHVRPPGKDFKAGAQLLPEGYVLGPAALGLAAAANLAEVKVWKKPRVGILTSGDELKPPGSALLPGDVINSNSVALKVAIEAWGGEAVDLGVVGDREGDIRALVERGAGIDLFLPIGGASVGDHDLMRPAFAGLGFEMIFEKIAVRPGKPTWFAARGETLVLGLPGNPASAHVCARLFLRPLLTGSQNALEHVRVDVPLNANGPRAHFMRAVVRRAKDGTLIAKPTPDQDSSLIWPLVQSNAFLFRPAGDKARHAGDGAFAMLTGEVV